MENSQKNNDDLNNQTVSILNELYQELGMIDFMYIDTYQYLEQLESKRDQIIKKIRQYYGTANQDLHSNA